MGVSIMQWRSAIGGFASSFAGSSSPRISLKSSEVSFSSFQCFCLGLILATITFQLAGQPNLYNTKPGSELQQPKSSALQDPAVQHSNGLLRASNFSHLTSKQRNQLMKALNGNRANRGIKLAHWNAGSAHLCNKMTELEQVVAGLHPHVLRISEANFKRGHTLEDVQMEDYDLLLSKTIENKVTRSGATIIVFTFNCC
jgi:hypothetical protein